MQLELYYTIILHFLKNITFYEILISLTTSFNICCVLFLSRSFITIGLQTLRVLGSGAMFEGLGTFFGVRWELVESALRQKAEVTFGFILLGLASIGNFAILFMNKIPPNNWIHWILYLIFSGVMASIFWALGFCIVVPSLYYLFFVKAVKESLYRQITRSEDKVEIQQIWLGPDGTKKLMAQIKCYNLDYFEERAFRKLKNYITAISKGK